MFAKMVPLSADRHRSTRVKQSTSMKFAANYHVAYLTLHEFVRGGAVYPIVFVQDKDEQSYRSVALLGLQSGENLFVDKSGKWQASYIPAMIRRYPFALSPSDEESKFVVCIDESSKLLSESEGNLLFSNDGKPTEVVENVKKYLSELQTLDKATQELTQFLVQHDLLVPLNLRINNGKELRKITGCFIVSEEKFNQLSDHDYQELKNRKLLQAIHAHLMSLSQIERLVGLARKRNKTPHRPKPLVTPKSKSVN